MFTKEGVGKEEAETQLCIEQLGKWEILCIPDTYPNVLLHIVCNVHVCMYSLMSRPIMSMASGIDEYKYTTMCKLRSPKVISE